MIVVTVYLDRVRGTHPSFCGRSCNCPGQARTVSVGDDDMIGATFIDDTLKERSTNDNGALAVSQGMTVVNRPFFFAWAVVSTNILYIWSAVIH